MSKTHRHAMMILAAPRPPTQLASNALYDVPIGGGRFSADLHSGTASPLGAWDVVELSFA